MGVVEKVGLIDSAGQGLNMLSRSRKSRVSGYTDRHTTLSLKNREDEMARSKYNAFRIM
jgi:hypothetical protein